MMHGAYNVKLPDYTETHLKILGTRRVSRGKFHTDNPYLLETPVRKFSPYHNLAPQILAPQISKGRENLSPTGRK
jgi:hypothetical protein